MKKVRFVYSRLNTKFSEQINDVIEDEWSNGWDLVDAKYHNDGEHNEMVMLIFREL